MTRQKTSCPFGELAFRGKALKRFQAPPTRLDGEASARLGGAGHDEILEKAASFDIGLELEVGLLVHRAPHVAGAMNQLLEGDGPDHDGLRMRAGAAFPHLSLVRLPPPLLPETA